MNRSKETVKRVRVGTLTRGSSKPLGTKAAHIWMCCLWSMWEKLDTETFTFWFKSLNQDFELVFLTVIPLKQQYIYICRYIYIYIKCNSYKTKTKILQTVAKDVMLSFNNVRLTSHLHLDLYPSTMFGLLPVCSQRQPPPPPPPPHHIPLNRRPEALEATCGLCNKMWPHDAPSPGVYFISELSGRLRCVNGATGVDRSQLLKKTL